MIHTARRTLILLAVTLGVTAATAGPAAAGIVLCNHCEPHPSLLPTR